MPRMSLPCTALIVTLALGAPAADAQQSLASITTPAEALPAPASASAPADSSNSYAVDAEYRVGIDDILQVNVFEAPDLSGTVKVDAAGGFVLPIVGRVNARGRTTGEIQQDLLTRLDGRYLRNPVVTVTVKEAVSQRVTVNGAVLQPGVYPLSGPTTLIQALALAKGPDPHLANTRRVAIFRRSGGDRHAQVYDLASIESGKAADPFVQSDDIIIVDTSGVKSFFSNFGPSLGLISVLHGW